MVRCREVGDGDSARAVDMGDGEEEQLLSGEGVRKRNGERTVQPGEQQSLQPQLLQAFRYAYSLPFCLVPEKFGGDETWCCFFVFFKFLKC